MGFCKVTNIYIFVCLFVFKHVFNKKRDIANLGSIFRMLLICRLVYQAISVPESFVCLSLSFGEAKNENIKLL